MTPTQVTEYQQDPKHELYIMFREIEEEAKHPLRSNEMPTLDDMRLKTLEFFYPVEEEIEAHSLATFD